MKRGTITARLAAATVLALAFRAPSPAQLFENLQAFGERLDAGDPAVLSEWEGGKEGPKGIAAGDLDGANGPDLAVSNLDGTVTVHLNRGGGEFHPPLHLATGTQTLRDVVIADLTGDGRADIATASILDARVLVFPNLGGGRFGEPIGIVTWTYARNLATGDFDGDGAQELVVAGGSVGLRHYRRSGDGSFEKVVDLRQLGANSDWSKPVYSLKTFRPAGATRDLLAATHAWSAELCILDAGASGALEVQDCLAEVPGIYFLEVGALITPAADGRLDLITAHPDEGTVKVRRGKAGLPLFEEAVHQEIRVPGGPRSIAIADLDGDGWNDLAVVLRNLSRVVTYRNRQGILTPSSEMPVGESPREVAAADFSGDGQPDLAVINRLSADVSVLTGFPGEVGFSALDGIYLTDGQVAGLSLRDMNADGRDDVVQLHQASGDFSVRLARPDGSLEPPRFYTLGSIPADLVVVDVNNDGRRDIVAVNLGRSGLEEGSISVRLGDGQGGFGEERRFFLPEGLSGRLFGVEPADFDGDGNLDLAAGFFDCRLSFFRGTGDGRFEPTRTHMFLYESRAMAAGDFDRDGDIDLAGASFTGEVLVVENRGDLLTTSELTRTSYPSPSEAKFGTTAMVEVDLNGDGDLDLAVGSGSGTMVYQGAEGMSFTLLAESLPGTEGVPSSDVATADFDGDGEKDLAVACQVLSCVIVLTRGQDGKLLPAVTVDVPAGRLLATGDLEGDGQADLAGAGEVLWTALSSRRARPGPPPVPEGERDRIPGLVINEFLALNRDLPLAQAGGRTSDWLELYNGFADPLSLAGYKVVLETPGAPAREFSLPAGRTLPPRGHLLLVGSAEVPAGPAVSMGFPIPAEGGKLMLLDPRGTEVDRVDYTAQREDVSYARYRDGLRSFVFNLYPSPEAANADNGPIDPVMDLVSAVPAELAAGDPIRAPMPGETIRFYARGSDDVGILAASLLWRRLDLPGSPAQRVVLFDDGLNGDGAMQDGLFAGAIPLGLPARAEIECYLEVMDLTENPITIPEDAFFEAGSSENVYRLAVGASLPRLEISELVARNSSGLLDEHGQTADWVEVRNCSAQPVSLKGFHLGQEFPASEGWLELPDRVLAPGEHLVLFCDGSSDQGPLHAPFELGGDGGRLVLVGTAPAGGHAMVDVVHYGPQEQDAAWGRRRCGGDWASMVPTPGAANPEAGAARGDVDRSAVLDITDAILILHTLFLGASAACPGAMDADGSGRADISDAMFVLNHLFQGGPAPAAGTVDC